MTIINLTKEEVRLADENDTVYKTFPPDGDGVRIHAQGQELDIGGVKVELTSVTGIEGLPEMNEGTFYIVPQPVAYVVNRPDLLMPDTGPSAIREETGDVYAVRRLYSVSRGA